MNLAVRNNPYSTKEQDKDESARLIYLTITWAFARLKYLRRPSARHRSRGVLSGTRIAVPDLFYLKGRR